MRAFAHTLDFVLLHEVCDISNDEQVAHTNSSLDDAFEAGRIP